MRIANPLYDSVFKRLMQNSELAAGLIGRLLGVRIRDIQTKAQEYSQLVTVATKCGQTRRVRIFRMDFVATIADDERGDRKVLVELQKVQAPGYEERFRQYLGSHYMIPVRDEPLVPLVPIYLLGFTVNEELPLATKVQRQLVNMVTSEVIELEQGTDFVEWLSHDMVLVQIPKVPLVPTNDLERVLKVFDQRLQDGDDPHCLEIPDDLFLSTDPLVQRFLLELAKTIADKEALTQMNLEDEAVTLANTLVQAENERDAARAAEEQERAAKEAALAELAALRTQLRASGAS